MNFNFVCSVLQTLSVCIYDNGAFYAELLCRADCLNCKQILNTEDCCIAFAEDSCFDSVWS